MNNLNYIKKAFMFPIKNLPILFFYFVVYFSLNFFNDPLAVKWDIKQKIYSVHPLFYILTILVIPNIIILSGILGLIKDKIKNLDIKWRNFFKYCIKNLNNAIGLFIIIITIIFITKPICSTFGKYESTIAMLGANFIYTLFYALWALIAFEGKGIFYLSHENFFYKLKSFRLHIFIIFSLSFLVRICQIYATQSLSNFGNIILRILKAFSLSYVEIFTLAIWMLFWNFYNETKLTTKDCTAYN